MRTRPASYGAAVAGVAIFGAFLLGPSRAQQPAGQTKTAPKAQPKAQPNVQSNGDDKPLVFTTGARLVVVDVTVKDKNGKLIEGLKQSDFAVFEDGKPQKISVFEYQQLDCKPEPPPKLSWTISSSCRRRRRQRSRPLRRGDSISRQAADGVLLRLFLDADPGPVARAGRRPRVPEEATSPRTTKWRCCSTRA